MRLSQAASLRAMFGHPRSDCIAGVVVFLVAVPLCLGIALASGVPPVSGLVAGVVGGIVVPFLSRSPLSVTGPAAGLTAVVLFETKALGSFERLLTATMIAGCLQMALGFARTGRFAALVPDSVIGCKRLCVDTDYYDTFNRSNVSLVDLRERPIERFTERGIMLGGEEIGFDSVVFATGFDAMTGAIEKIDIVGRDGLPLRKAWSAGPVNYLGLSVHGFPNLFTVTGPGSPSVLTNMIVSIQHHVEWITDCIDWMRANGKPTIEAHADAQDRWVEHVNSVAGMTLYTSCSSWYLGANVPGKPRVFMPLPGFPAYAQHCAEVAQHGYRGFAT